MSPQIQLDDSNLPDYLRKVGLISPGDRLSVEKAGDGNINWVRRARIPGDGRSWVVKQARPALERFPEYQVSTRRIVMEARYYETVAPLDRRRLCPRVHLFDAGARVLVLEDLGDAERMDRAQARGADVRDVARELGAFLGAVHADTRDPALARRFRNDDMQRLHGEHIFRLPYRENTFPLSPALRARADAIAADASLLAAIAAAYVRYLEPRGALVHGDVQSGNILLESAGPQLHARLLDAEIAHVGDPAFDVGILAAHLWLPGVARGAPGEAQPAVRTLWDAYRTAAGDADARDVLRYAGIEMLRRTIGAARVPWVERDDAAQAVLDAGIDLIRAERPSLHLDDAHPDRG
jgi:5-methylthioribose kinase